MNTTVHNVTTRQNVLLIEDDEFEVDLARRAAAECCPEIELKVLESVDAVLDWLGDTRKKAPYLIMLDLKLPKLDGLAVLRRLRQHDATRDIPIVVFSAEYIQDDVRLSYQVGANTFVAKPADVAQFSAFLREQMEYWTHSRQREALLAGNAN
ncbi:MAG: response regulator [Nitrosomonadales bacterium]|nr:response regulator [Nitrosomonadales bacterium]